MEIFLQYIPADCILLVLGLVAIGEILKTYTVLANKYLTLVLPILGALFMGFGYIDSTEVFLASDLVRQLILGIICGLGSTGGYEWFKNTFLNTSNNTKIITVVPNESKKECEDCKICNDCESCEPYEYNTGNIDENQDAEE